MILVVGWWLDRMILKVFSRLDNSMILFYDSNLKLLQPLPSNLATLPPWSGHWYPYSVKHLIRNNIKLFTLIIALLSQWLCLLIYKTEYSISKEKISFRQQPYKQMNYIQYEDILAILTYIYKYNCKECLASYKHMLQSFIFMNM